MESIHCFLDDFPYLCVTDVTSRDVVGTYLMISELSFNRSTCVPETSTLAWRSVS